MPVGELYKRLVVLDGLPPKSYHTYYELVREVIEEAQKDFEETDDLGECAKRWFGNV